VHDLSIPTIYTTVLISSWQNICVRKIYLNMQTFKYTFGVMSITREGIKIMKLVQVTMTKVVRLRVRSLPYLVID